MVFIWLISPRLMGLFDHATIERASAVLDRRFDLLKQRSQDLFGRDLALGDTHLFRRHQTHRDACPSRQRQLPH
jgi:hypothetical protein